MKTKCYSVRLQSLYRISPKCFKAHDFNGNECLLPASQVFGQDYDVSKSEAYWISDWILGKKTITYSTKKAGWYNPDTGNIEPDYTFASEHIEVLHHVPVKVEPINNSQPNKNLVK